MRSRNGYTEEQRKKAVTMYQERPELRVADIAEECGIYDPSTISHWVKEMGLPLRVIKSSGWSKNCTTSHKSKGKMVTCPECGESYKVRDGQKFCHFCGADIAPVEEKFDKKLKELIEMSNLELSLPPEAVELIDQIAHLYSQIKPFI